MSETKGVEEIFDREIAAARQEGKPSDFIEWLEKLKEEVEDAAQEAVTQYALDCGHRVSGR